MQPCEAMTVHPPRPPARRPGRRPGPSTTRADILTAARASFAEMGFDRTSVRGVAARAGVDPALVHRFFGSKDDLLSAALDGVMNPAERIPALLQGDPDALGERLVRFFLSVWEDGPGAEVLVAVLRSAATHEHAAEVLRGFIGREVLGRLAVGLGGGDASLRAALAGSQLVGMAMARYVVRVEPLASADRETLVAALAPTLQRYLTGPL